MDQSFSQTSTRVSITRGLVEENHATVKPDSGMKLRNLEILKKLLGKSSQCLLSEQPCEPKSLDVALKIAGVEKIPSETCGCGQQKERKWRWILLSSVVGDSQIGLI